MSRDFSPEAGGVPLDWKKLDFQTWEIQPRAAGTVRVSFDYLANAVDRAVAWTAPNFAFFNGTNSFCTRSGADSTGPLGSPFAPSPHGGSRPEWTPPGQIPLPPPIITISPTCPSTSGDSPSTAPRSRASGFAWRGTRRRVSRPARRDRTFAWLQKFVPAEIAVFGEAPFRNYTIFQRSDTVVNGGGLEHQASQVDEVLTSQLDAGYLPGLYSHEFFHAWNVKRLRPADLVPYRYDDAQPTTWLWVSEGMTDYYGGVATDAWRSLDSTAFFGFIANEIAQVGGAPPTAVSDASYNAWIDATDGSGGLYYPKGGLTGFLLDVMIRDASNNHRSLDQVMRSTLRHDLQARPGIHRRRMVGRSITSGRRKIIQPNSPVATSTAASRCPWTPFCGWRDFARVLTPSASPGSASGPR